MTYPEPQRKDPPGPAVYPLKWHKFLIYFALWAGAILNVVNGFNHITGGIYEGSASYVYYTYPGMKTTDTVMGVAIIALAMYMIFVRFQLAGFKTGAPKKLVILYVLTAGLNLVHVLALSAATGTPFSASFLGILVGNITPAIINSVYYGKRADLFVN